MGATAPDPCSGLLERLHGAELRDAREVIRHHMNGPPTGSDGQALCRALMQRPDVHMRCHGLLVARLCGDTDALLIGLHDEASSVVQQAAQFICQVG